MKVDVRSAVYTAQNYIQSIQDRDYKIFKIDAETGDVKSNCR